MDDSASLQLDIQVDTRGSDTAIKGVNTAWQSSEQHIIQSAQRMGQSFDSQWTRIARGAQETARAVEAGLAATARGLGHVSDALVSIDRGFTSAKHTIEQTTALVVGSTTVVAAHGAVAEKATEAYRALRIIASPTTFTFGTVGLGILLETAGKLAVAQAQLIEQQSILAAKSKSSYEDVATLGFAASRIGQQPDFFANAAAAAGGIDQLADKLKRLGEIGDPVQRAQEAFRTLGADAEKLFPYLDDRLAENQRRVQEWGLVLSSTSRTQLASFGHDLEAFKNTFKETNDEVAATLESQKQYLGRWFASLYDFVKRGGGVLFDLADRLDSRLGTSAGALSPGSLTGAERYKATADIAGQVGLNLRVRDAEALLPDARRIYSAGDRDRKKTRLDEQIEFARKQLFYSDTNADHVAGAVRSAAEVGGFDKRANLINQYINSTAQRKRLKAEDDAAADAAKAAQDAQTAAEAAARLLQSTVKGIQNRVQDLGAGPTQLLFNQRSRALAEFGQKPGSALDKGYLDLIRDAAKQEGAKDAEKDRQFQQFLASLPSSTATNLYTDFNFGLRRRIEDDAKEFHSKTAADRAIAGIDLDAERVGLERGANRAQRVAGLEIDNPRNAALESYRIQVDLANKLYDADIRRSLLEDDLHKRRVDEAKARADFQKATDDAQVERQLKLAEIEHQRGDAFKRTFAEGALAIQNRNFGGFLKSQAGGFEQKVLENTGGLIFDRFKGVLSGTGVNANSTVGKLLEGTPFGSRGDKIPTVTSTVGPAVPVVVVNQAGQVTSGTQASRSSGGLSVPGAAFLPRSILDAVLLSAGAGTSAAGVPGVPAGVIDTAIHYGTGGSESFSGAAPGTSSFHALSQIIGGPGGTSGFAGPVGGYGGSTSGGVISSGSTSHGPGAFGGLLGQAKGSLLSLGSLFGIHGGGVFSNPGGGVFAGGGFGDKLGAIGHSTGTALLGAGLAIDGLRRGGLAGTLEATGGGAAIGFKFGGAPGAAIGATIGAAAGLLREFVFKTGPEQVKDQVKTAYGIGISTSMAKQILQISNERYGGQIHVAIRSKEVIDLLDLYSQSTGQVNQFGVVNRARQANLVEQGGTLFQQGTYENGRLIGLQSSLPSLTGAYDAIAPVGTGRDYNPGAAVGPSSGPTVLHIDSAQAAGFVSSASSEAAAQNYNRLQYAALQLSPGTLIR